MLREWEDLREKRSARGGNISPRFLSGNEELERIITKSGNQYQTIDDTQNSFGRGGSPGASLMFGEQPKNISMMGSRNGSQQL